MHSDFWFAFCCHGHVSSYSRARIAEITPKTFPINFRPDSIAISDQKLFNQNWWMRPRHASPVRLVVVSDEPLSRMRWICSHRTSTVHLSFSYAYALRSRAGFRCVYTSSLTHRVQNDDAATSQSGKKTWFPTTGKRAVAAAASEQNKWNMWN